MTFRLGRWVAYVTAAEGVGFMAPTAAFALAATLGFGPWPTYVTLVLAGAVEGSCLGWGQSRALTGVLSGADGSRWVVATAAGAAAAWVIGMVPPTLIDTGVTVDFGDPLVLVVVAGAAIVLLASIPTIQWFVLRRAFAGAWRWIPLNMGAWLAGLVFTFLPSPFIDESTPAAVLGASYAAAGVAMAVTVAVLTGLGLRRMLRSRG